jgi:thymidylate kinase
MQRNLIVVDAIDGAGKSNVIHAFSQQWQEKGHTCFDVSAFSKEHHRLPSPDDFSHANLLLSAEPTFTWIGAAIRESIIKQRAQVTYPARLTAESYAIDRYVLFSEVYLPFFEQHPNGWIIQDRGAITSLAYQPLQAERNHEELSLEWLQSLAGNALELANAPKLLVLLEISPEIAQARLQSRHDKQDNSLFDALSFQQALTHRYHDESVLQPYRAAGTRIEYIDVSQSPEAVRNQAIALFKTLDFSP